MNDEQRGAGAPTEEERARAIREQLKSLHAFDLAYEMMISLVTFGYQKMGLTDETRELRDLGDARLAIELLRANLEILEREQAKGSTRDVRSTLAQMQLGYAQAVRLAGEAPAAQPQQTAEPPAAEPAADEAIAKKPAAEKAGPRRPTAKKPAAEKAAPRKPAAKKSAAKKAAVKKAAPKKPAAKKPRGDATPQAG